jgi:hypothetical protein
MYGNISEIKNIIKKEGLDTISDIFTHHPTKIYTPQAFNFIKNYILGIKHSLNSDKYVKTLY